nr:hypothetical protein [Ktedonobacteraceae bacterium]
MSQTPARGRAFRLTVLITLVLLVLQYVLGMMSNLDVQLPSGNDWSWVFGHSLIIQLHIYIGTLLIVVALVALILSIVARHPVGIIAAVVGLALLVFAWLSGDQFLVTQHNDLSLSMALGFMGAFIAYLLGYFFSGVPRGAQREQHRDGLTVDSTPVGPLQIRQ